MFISFIFFREKVIPSRNLSTSNTCSSESASNNGNFTRYYISTIYEDLPVKSSLSFTALRKGCTRDKRMQNVLEDRRSCAATMSICSSNLKRFFRCVLKDYFIWNAQCVEQIHWKSNKTRYLNKKNNRKII